MDYIHDVNALYNFIHTYYTSIKALQGVPKGLSSPGLTINKKDIQEIIANSLDDENAFLMLHLDKANPFKRTANLITHIYLHSPIKDSLINKISSQTYGPSERAPKNIFAQLASAPNHQNALIGVVYGLSCLQKICGVHLKLSCHSLVELVQTICQLRVKDTLSHHDYQQLMQFTSMLSLYLEQMVYKTSGALEDEHCEDLLEFIQA